VRASPLSTSRGTLTALRRREGGAVDRDQLITRAADAVLAHWRPAGRGDQAVLRAATATLDGHDAADAELFAVSLVFMREELGEAAVRQVRDRHARQTA
jgi:hypothetical protein